LNRNSRREFRGLAEGEEVGLLSNGPIFGEITAGLAHDPDRGTIDRLTTTGAQEKIVGHGSLLIVG